MNKRAFLSALIGLLLWPFAPKAKARTGTLRLYYDDKSVDVECRLEPVGIDVDGKIKPIDELSYAPQGGFGLKKLADAEIDSVSWSKGGKPLHGTLYRVYRLSGSA